MLALYPYQENGIAAGRSLLASGINKILFVAATGGGKTICFSQITSGVIQKGKRACIIAPRREIIQQTYRKLIDAELDPFQIGVQLGGVGTHREVKSDNPWIAHARTRPKAPIQLGTIQSFARRDWVSRNHPPDIVILDEAHLALAPSYMKFVEACHAINPKMAVLGFTATPWRGDRKPLRLLFDELITIAKPHELAEWINPLTGCPVLMRPRVFTVPPHQRVDTSKIRIKKGPDGIDYDQHQLSEASNNPELIGAIVENWQLRAAGLRTVCFAVSVEHSKNIRKRFLESGIPAEHLDGDMSTIDREAVLGRLASGQTLVVTNCNVLTEGFDLPVLGCVQLARPTESRSVGIQQMGRGLRYAPGKATPIILDHAGFCEDHGGPMFDHEYSLDAPPKRKGHAKMGKTCPNCFYVADIGDNPCPNCGELFPVFVPPDDMNETKDLLVEIPADHPARKKLEEHESMRIEFESENQRRLEAGERPRRPGALDEDWKRMYGKYPPAGHKKPKITKEQLAAIEIHEEIKAMKKMGLQS